MIMRRLLFEKTRLFLFCQRREIDKPHTWLLHAQQDALTHNKKPTPVSQYDLYTKGYP
jgi:hypothetical protein